MTSNRPFCRALSLLCVCLVLLPALLSTPAAAASKKRIQSYHYPTNTLIGEKLPYNQLSDEKGNPAQIEIKDGQYTLITYWASWCPDCQQEFEHLPQMLPVLKEYGNVQWYLVNRTDGADETLASASSYAKKYGMGLPSLYDTQLKFRYTLGINFIPTTILLNPQGEVELMIPRILKSASEVRGLLDYAVNSAANATADYVKKNLMLSDGTVKTAEASKRTSSAAQSLLAEYASTAFDRELLNTQRNWLAANQTTGDLGDDLRFLKALSAQKGYEVDAMELEQQLIARYFPGNQLSGKVSLSDLDPSALSATHSPKLAEQALSVIEKGFIGSDFPLYYNEYNADKNSYSGQTVDMTQSLMTVYHLAQSGKVKKSTLQWLKNAVEGDGIRARYTTDGKVVAKYNYEMPALYGLTALIALETGEKSLFTQSLLLMENSRTFSSSDKNNGAFTTKNSDKAFDQCIALLVYANM